MKELQPQDVNLGIPLGEILINLWAALSSKREQATHRIISIPPIEFPNLQICEYTRKRVVDY